MNWCRLSSMPGDCHKTGSFKLTLLVPTAVILVIASSLNPALSQQPKNQNQIVADDRIKALLVPIREKYGMPGLIGAIIAKDQVIAIGSVGLRKVGSRELFQVTDVVHIGSCTKSMTATLMALLVEENTLKWDSTVLSVFPELGNTLHRDYAKVTLAQLLSHHAGLPRKTPWEELDTDKSLTEQRLDALKLVLRNPPMTKPGTQFLYSNFGYVVAARMAEQVTGASWEDLMQKRLFGPLGMKSAGFGPPGTEGKVDQPWGHQLNESGREPIQMDLPPVVGPAGTVHCSMSDWAKFVMLHVRGEQGNGRLLKAETFRLLHTPLFSGNYAFGFIVGNAFGGRALSHAGSDGAWMAVMTLVPQSDLAVLVAVNQGGDQAKRAAQEATQALFLHYLNIISDRKRK